MIIERSKSEKYMNKYKNLSEMENYRRQLTKLVRQLTKLTKFEAEKLDRLTTIEKQ